MNAAQVAARIKDLGIRPLSVKARPQSHVKAAKAVIALLEDRRVLFNDLNFETPEYCLRSALEIRQHLTRMLPGFPDQLAAHVRAILGAIRRFLDADGPGPWPPRGFHDGMPFAAFSEKLGRLRAEVGLRVAIIAVLYRQSIGSELASILPDPRS